MGDDEYARQLLITPIKDNPRPWSDARLTQHYLTGNGKGVTLSRIGYLGSVIAHYSEKLGVYDRVNRQIIDRAKEVVSGNFTYDFRNSYNFQSVLFTLGDSTVSGVFSGDVRKENKTLLVISGIIRYDFFDQYKDPASFTENLMDILDLTREEAERWVGDSGDIAGTVYPITDHWQTKFSATVKIEH